MKRARLLSSLMVLTVAAAGRAHACSVCMGAADDTMTRGMQAGIMVLLGIIATVLVGLGGFIGYLAYRGRRFRAGTLALR